MDAVWISNLDLPFLFRFLFTDFPKKSSRGPLLLVWFSSLRDLKQLLRESLGLANKSHGIYGTSFSEFVMMKSGLDDEISHWKKHSSWSLVDWYLILLDKDSRILAAFEVKLLVMDLVFSTFCFICLLSSLLPIVLLIPELHLAWERHSETRFLANVWCNDYEIAENDKIDKVQVT